MKPLKTQGKLVIPGRGIVFMISLEENGISLDDLHIKDKIYTIEYAGPWEIIGIEYRDPKDLIGICVKQVEKIK